MLKGEVIGDFGLDCLMISFLMNRAVDLSASTFNPSSLMTEKQRACVHCRATRTPLWRAGPAGPRSLCNACGIRYRKMKMKMNSNNNGGLNNNKMGKGKKMGGSEGSLKVRVVRLGREIMVHRPTTEMEDNNELVAESIGEEEQTAAMLLMALSSSYV